MKSALWFFITVLLLGVLPSAKAQDSIPGLRKEFYISLSDFSPVNIGLRYKKQIGPKTYVKLGLVSLSAAASSYNNSVGVTFPVSTQSYSGGFEIGLEWRKYVTKKLSLFHGPAIRAIAQYNVNRTLDPSIPQNQQTTESNSYTGAIPYSIGFLFQLHSNFHVAAEIGPSAYVTFRESIQIKKARDISGGFQFNSSNVILSLVYRY